MNIGDRVRRYSGDYLGASPIGTVVEIEPKKPYTRSERVCVRWDGESRGHSWYSPVALEVLQ